MMSSIAKNAGSRGRHDAYDHAERFGESSCAQRCTERAAPSDLVGTDFLS
jgi:hypothetical protein